MPGRRACFNGAALFQVRKDEKGWMDSLMNYLLQWGRTLSSAESRIPTSPTKSESRCFNGAALFQVRKGGQGNANDTGRCCFNGAALFQVRKAESHHDALAHSLQLQWGRTLSSAESANLSSSITSPRLGFNGAALFQVRKASGFKDGLTPPLWLQWGRTLSSAESDGAVPHRAAIDWLQWGRTLSSAERLKHGEGADFAAGASMGPHSFKCGKRQFRRDRFPS